MTERSNLERQREHFNRISETYLKGRRDANHIEIKNIMWDGALRHAKSLAGWHVPNSYRILDALCGYAEGYDIMKTHVGMPGEYVGFDYSDEIVDNLQQSRPDLNIIHADATTYKPEPESFDVIFLAGGLHHVPIDASKVVQQLATGLRKGGLFINLEPTHANPIYKSVRDRIYRKNAIFDEATERAFHLTELQNMFKSAGLSNLLTHHVGLLGYILYYNPYAFPNLNLGGVKAVRAASAIDRLFRSNVVGKLFSFATLTIWKK